jgi:hypothetical protein
VISLRVAGTYDGDGRELAVQILTDPDDLASWTPIAKVTATDGRFAVEVRPVSRAAELTRWPVGGVLRVRVVDDQGHALAYEPSLPDRTVITIANAMPSPSDWTYLTEQPAGSVEETLAYYTTIDAPPTLDDFIGRYGFATDDTTATYYNVGDLGIGRDMHCRVLAAPAGVACYSRNFGTFGGTVEDGLARAVDGLAPLATVAMVYRQPIEAPNAVQFVVYDSAGVLATSAALDTRGDNTSVPQNCLNCHGGRGRYDATTHSIRGARFLPLDPAAFAFSTSPGFSFSAQEDRFRRLNRVVAGAEPAPATRELIEGMFPANGAPYDPAFVPPAWSAAADRRVYREVVAPFCRSCHVSFAGGATDAFASAAAFRSRSAEIIAHVCTTGPHTMPVAEQTARQFFDSGARALLLAWLDAPGACVP